MAIARKLLTAEDLLRLPDDGRRHELIAGELRTMAPAGEEHGGIALTIGADLNRHVRAHKLGLVVGAETGFLLATDPDLVRAPDAAFVARERVRATGVVPGYRQGAPDLAIEVVSPHDLYTEVEEKVETWLAHGARLVIVVDPRRRTVRVQRSLTEVRHLTVEDTLEGEDVVPGWALPVRELFALTD